MINDANIDLAGFVASEPFFKRLDSGVSTAKLRVAYTERRFNRETGEWGDGPTSFVTVLCWRTLADNVAVCLRKGEPVLVRGRLRVREYQDKEGSPRSVTEVEASSVGHDLSRGVAHFSRTRRAPGETAAESAEAPAAASPQDGDEEPVAGDGSGLPDGRAEEEAAGPGGADRSGAGEGGAGEGGVDESGWGKGGAGKSGAGRNGAGRNGAAKSGAGRSGAGRSGAGKSGAGENGASGGAVGDGMLDDRAVAEFASEIG
jgi:single-strand DNA-binding protein